MDEGYPFAAGNAYPTHGIGPMAQLLDIHHGDRFTELYAISSDPDAPLSERISTILLRTERGRTASLHLDLHTPRPYSRLQSLSGREVFDLQISNFWLAIPVVIISLELCSALRSVLGHHVRASSDRSLVRYTLVSIPSSRACLMIKPASV